MHCGVGGTTVHVTFVHAQSNRHTFMYMECILIPVVTVAAESGGTPVR